VTFLPSFIWIFAGAPFIEKMRGNTALGGAMSAITAAVVGVILNLAVWFGLHVLFAEAKPVALGPLTLDVPVFGSLLLPSLVLTLGAAFAIFRLRLSVIAVLAMSAVLGIGWTLLA
jgi:chromate transporter